MDNQHSDEVAAFLAVASAGSFVSAGRLLQRHATVISKRIAQFEQRLGVRLIERTTRQVRLTLTGEQLATKLQAAVGAIKAAEEEATSGAAEVRGMLRIAMPAAMGRQWLAPRLPEFIRQYPQIEVVADFSDRFVDMVAEGFEIAVRIGSLPDSRLVAKKLADHRRIMCASPAYLATHGELSQPAHLSSHQCLRFSGFTNFAEWRLSNGQVIEKVRVNGPLTTNDSQALLAGAIAGLGILAAGEWLMAEAIAAGQLVRVLPDWQLEASGGVYLVQPSNQYQSAACLAFKAWLVQAFSPGAPWDR